LCTPRAQCRARRRHRRYQEDEANGFAMVMLMPPDELATVCDARPMTLEASAQLAKAVQRPPRSRRVPDHRGDVPDLRRCPVQGWHRALRLAIPALPGALWRRDRGR